MQAGRLRFQNIGSHSLLHTHGILQNLLLCYINSKFYSKHLHTLFDVKYSGSRRTGIKGAIIGDVCFVESWVTRPATVIAHLGAKLPTHSNSCGITKYHNLIQSYKNHIQSIYWLFGLFGSGNWGLQKQPGFCEHHATSCNICVESTVVIPVFYHFQSDICQG